METQFLREALFAGMTASAFKLGTVLTLGWFWSRVEGCSVLYRGERMDAIDSDTMLAVVDLDFGEILPPSYLQHETGSTCFYVVRRVNCCGYLEHTLFAAVKVSIDTQGDLAQPRPSGILDVKADQVDGSRIQLVWFYYPLDQESSPLLFKVYCDSGAGQMDYQNPIASVNYIGQRYYCFETESLNPGDYAFCVRAEDAAGEEGSSSALMKVQLGATSPGAMDLLSVEVI
ncbi:MAG TPA: hypothetical protein VMX13_01040 [Sedimentisphaerales bacterium]|nr:hypothetical protein [Sedimentisphaerales bacterium]